MVFDAGLNTSSYSLSEAAPYLKNPGLTLWALDPLVSETPEHLELKELNRLHINIEWYIMFCTMILRSYCELGCSFYVGISPKSWEICAVKDKAWWLAGEWIFFHDCSGINFQNFIGYHKESLWYGDMICSQGICQKFEKYVFLTNRVSHKFCTQFCCAAFFEVPKSTTSDWYHYFIHIFRVTSLALGQWQCNDYLPPVILPHWPQSISKHILGLSSWILVKLSSDECLPRCCHECCHWTTMSWNMISF